MERGIPRGPGVKRAMRHCVYERLVKAEHGKQNRERVFRHARFRGPIISVEDETVPSISREAGDGEENHPARKRQEI